MSFKIYYFSADCNFMDYFRKCRVFVLSHMIVAYIETWMHPSDGQWEESSQSPRDRNTHWKYTFDSLCLLGFFSPILQWLSVDCPGDLWSSVLVFKYLSVKYGNQKMFTKEPPLYSTKIYH